MRGQASPEVWRVTFEQSADGITWTSLGKGSRIAGGWELTGLSLPFNQNHYVRARGYTAGSNGEYGSSSSIFESIRLFYLASDVSNASLYGVFGSSGIWRWNGSTWNFLTPSEPQALVASGSLLYGDFGSSGIWRFSGTSWSQLTPADPQNMVVSGSFLYGDFGPSGIWMWNGSTWSQITPSDPTGMAVAP
jgi:hypothetical protein